jgi:hypothetical protein
MLKVHEGTHNHVTPAHITAYSAHRNDAPTTEIRA